MASRDWHPSLAMLEHSSRIGPKAVFASCLLGLVAAQAAQAQVPAATAAPPVISAPAPMLTRGPDGHVTVRATRIAEPMSIDGRLDEGAYRTVPSITDFIQQEPSEGAPVTEKTEAWILYDDTTIYVACRCWDANPDRIVANDMRRDSPNVNQHDSFGVQFDPFNDGRGGFFFYTTPVGGVRDAMTSDARANNDWNTVWEWKASRSGDGWIAEIAIPFKSLRYRPGPNQTWGVQVRRLIRSKNERVHLTKLSAAWGSGAWNHMTHAATLVGIETPPASLNIEFKPYGIARLTTDRLSRPAVRNDFDPDAGFDVKYGVTKSLTFDFTYNTDFAQVEADEAQVNLTRFALSLPEKREFFLEGGGIFTFGTVTGASADDAPLIFYSRRIGLSDGRPLPVVGGGRLTGKAGPWSVGAINIEVDDAADAGVEQTNFTVLRLKRNILRRSSIGGIYTRRSISTIAPGANDVWGLDATLGFFEHLNVGGYVAQSRTADLRGEDLNYRGQFVYDGDRYGLTLDRQVAGANFNPEVGFMRRQDFRSSVALGRFSPRTRGNRVVRKWIYEGGVTYITDNDNQLESRAVAGEFRAELHTSDAIAVRYERLHEFLPEDFPLEGIAIPSGGYSFGNAVISYTAGQQHRLSGTGAFETGGFFGGRRRTAEFTGRLEVTPRLGIEPNISFNWIDVPQGSVTTTVVGGRATLSITPRMFVAALGQYSSSSTSVLANVRFRWEYQPGSELFLVYTEGRSTFPSSGTELQSRGVVLKINRLFRF
jgi:hypothetical protein